MDVLTPSNSSNVNTNDNKKKLQTRPYLVGVAGGSGCGKTTLCSKLREVIENKSLLILSFDSFYIPLADPSKAEDYNFDAPEALDFNAAYEVLSKLIRGEDAEVPIYNFKTHQREKHVNKVSSAEIILFEGIFTLYDKRIRDLMSLKLFIVVDDDERLSRRILRDIRERNRTIESVLTQYHRFVKKSFEEFVRPTWKFADIVVPRGTSNLIAINFIVQKLRRQLTQDNRSKKNLKSDSYYGYEIFEDTYSNKGAALAPGIVVINDKKSQKELSKLLLLFNKSFSIDLFEYNKSTFTKLIKSNRMATKRFIKAGLRLLRFRVQGNLDNYSFFSYPLENSSKNLQNVDYAAVLVIFFGEKESDQLTKTLEEHWKLNSNTEFAIITIFSDTKSLNTLQDRHNHQKLTIYNIFCMTDSSKLKYCFKKNCQIEAAKITQEEYYHKNITQVAKKYQKKHSSQKEDTLPDEDELNGTSEKSKITLNPRSTNGNY